MPKPQEMTLPCEADRTHPVQEAIDRKEESVVPLRSRLDPGLKLSFGSCSHSFSLGCRSCPTKEEQEEGGHEEGKVRGRPDIQKT